MFVLLLLRLRFSMLADTARVTNVRIIIIIIITLNTLKNAFSFLLQWIQLTTGVS